MKRYTLGFIFSPDLSEVLLIEKTKPDWQKGKLNGVGGKLEYRESGIDCIVREVEEEVGLETSKAQWIHIGDIGSKEWNVEIFTTVFSGVPESVINKTEEKAAWYSATNLPPQSLFNLAWLVPLAIDRLANNEFTDFHVTYKN